MLQPSSHPESSSAQSPQTVSASAFSRRLLWLIILVLLLLIPVQIFQAWDELHTQGMDLQQDYIAGLRLRSGGDIFAPFSAAEISAIGVDEARDTGMRINAHPPLTALLFAPLTFLPYTLFTLVWSIGCAAILLAAVWAIIVELKLPLRGPWLLLGAGLLLQWYPVWLHLHLGQLTIPLFGLIVAAWLCLRRRRFYSAGALLGFAAALKIFPAFLLGYALLRRRWDMLFAGVAVVVSVVALQTVIDPQHWPTYFGQVAPRNAAEYVGSPRNASLNSISARLFAGSGEVTPLVDLPAAEPVVRLLLYVLVFSWFVLTLYRHRARDETAELSLFVCAMLLFSPLTWEHAYIFLLLPAAYTWQQLRRVGWRNPPGLTGLTAILLSTYPAEMVLLRVKAAYLPERIPSLVGVLAPGAFVFILCFIAVSMLMQARSA